MPRKFRDLTDADKEKIRVIAIQLLSGHLEKMPENERLSLDETSLHHLARKFVTEAHTALLAVDEYLCG